MKRKDDLFANRPDLPQYGIERTNCLVGLPKATGIWIQIAMGIACLMVFSTVLVYAGQQFPNDSTARTIAIFLGGAGSVGAWLALSKLAPHVSKDALTVFDGGVHLTERVLYVVPGGSRMTLTKGIRQVSLPWRVLQNFTVTNTVYRSEQHLQATVRIPDGRKMILNTADGPESAQAIEVFKQKLKA